MPSRSGYSTPEEGVEVLRGLLIRLLFYLINAWYVLMSRAGGYSKSSKGRKKGGGGG